MDRSNVVYHGTQDESAIDSFFDYIDTNKDGSITLTKLKGNYEEILVDDEIADIIMIHLDIDGNRNIDKKEFRSGVGKRLASCNLQKGSQDSNRETDRYHRKAKAEEMFKAIIILLIVGILMLTFLAEPLVESVRQFSESVNIEPFYVLFILVPLATNARTAIAAIRAASQKRHHTTSLTFSEVYIPQGFPKQHSGVFCSCLSHIFPRVHVAFFSRDSSCGNRLHNNGSSRKFQIHASQLDFAHRFPSLSILYGSCLLCQRCFPVYLKLDLES
ncbi:hypothetical protein L1987_02315 [Smallanthus sonchifolius]|uniref:Uncharacterized protein n=1 Tax=Smallanthus sonchifolius TaxID=185202 RepID=A0ACB9K7M3_9ASTR|nr:hypothetical protein L1987_02315 [Smallanthus sonchifolius]